MSTVSDLIHSSFRLIGAIAAGEILETNELNDALISLNQMIMSWNTEGASLFGRERLLVNVTGNSIAIVAIGPMPAGDEDINIPAEVHQCGSQ